MARSDNPLDDLKAWTLNQRLKNQSDSQDPYANASGQEGYPNAQQPYQPGGYPEQDFAPGDGHNPYPEADAHQVPVGHGDPAGGHAAHGHSAYGHPSYDGHSGHAGDSPVDPYATYEANEPASSYPGFDQIQQAYADPAPRRSSPTHMPADPSSPFSQAGASEPGFHATPGQEPRGFDLRDYGPGSEHSSGFGSSAGNPFEQGTEAAEPSLGSQRPRPIDGSGDEFDDDTQYYDPPPRRFGIVSAAVALVAGLVVVGGGMTVYNSVLGPSAEETASSAGEIPIVKAGDGPDKVAPKEPGGSKFANRDSELLKKIDKSNSDGGYVRSVSTIRVARDGRLIEPEKPAANYATTQVPGLNVVESLSRAPGVSYGPAQPNAQKPSDQQKQGQLPPVVPKQDLAPEQSVQPRIANAGAVTAPPSDGGAVTENETQLNLATRRTSRSAPVPVRNPVRVARAEPSPRVSPRVPEALPSTSGPIIVNVPPQQNESAGAAPGEANVARLNGPRPGETSAWSSITPESASSASTAALGARNAAPAGTLGFVAVLATKGSRIEALETFANLQQRHATILQNRVPDVRETDLKERGLGTMYRVLVGPPASRQVAESICRGLRATGYNGCWVTTY